MSTRRKPVHKVWCIQIGNFDDEQLRDRQFWENGQRMISIQKLPVVREYYIESKGGQGRRAEKKAIEMAKQDGITRPIIMSSHWVNNP